MKYIVEWFINKFFINFSIICNIIYSSITYYEASIEKQNTKFKFIETKNETKSETTIETKIDDVYQCILPSVSVENFIKVFDNYLCEIDTKYYPIPPDQRRINPLLHELMYHLVVQEGDARKSLEKKILHILKTKYYASKYRNKEYVNTRKWTAETQLKILLIKSNQFDDFLKEINKVIDKTLKK